MIPLACVLALAIGMLPVRASAACPETLDFTKRALNSNAEVNLCEQYLGKVVLIVNTARESPALVGAIEALL